MAQNWILIISEQHRYQGVSYKSDIIVISGLDQGDRQVPHLPYLLCSPPALTVCRCWSRSTPAATLPACWTARTAGILVASSLLRLLTAACRFVLKGVNYNPLDVMNCLMSRRGYQVNTTYNSAVLYMCNGQVEGEPQQRTLPNIHNKDEK